jgi:hypothetical protein
MWGASSTPAGAPVDFGTLCSPDNCDGNRPWRFGQGNPFNVVWGTVCGGSNCDGTVWSTTVVWGTSDGDGTVVWGTDQGDGTVVWGTSDGGDGTVVWGTSDGDGTVVWGTSCSDPACEPVIWPR